MAQSSTQKVLSNRRANLAIVGVSHSLRGYNTEVVLTFYSPACDKSAQLYSLAARFVRQCDASPARKMLLTQVHWKVAGNH